jgi:hypothetical protein
LLLGWKLECEHAKFVLFPAPAERQIHNSSKFNVQCSIAEQNEAKVLTEGLNWLSDQICQDALKLCFESAQTADFGQHITQETIDNAEKISEECFNRLSRDLVEKAHNVVDSQQATELTFTLPRPIQMPRME